MNSIQKSSAGKILAATVAVLTLACHAPAPTYAITIDWATIGDVGNAGNPMLMNDRTNGYGAVGYEYRISKHEVTNTQYVEFLNATAATDGYALYNPSMHSETYGGITRSGTPGGYSYSVKANAVGRGPGGSDYTYADKPVLYVSWYDTVRFANWLTSGDTESGTYTITGGGANSGAIVVPDQVTLGPGSFFLPTEDEWCKAAYYDAGTSSYFRYATGTDSSQDTTRRRPIPATR